MTEVTLDIKKWGNSLGVRLPAVIAREANLHSDQRVRISIIDKQIIITPIVSEALTLEERLANFDPAVHGGEAMSVSESVGAEKW
ncbi:MAG: AbrB/MazE/SpoVT family DNA-binding domain-containing protein [Gammaproteobacteria bacterium]|nr:AbrB/MazE/SpoVT family DNA-binding domain-containing protein [Gammaproteobacteria bacterium]MBQ0839751.1 AbrB/MazE/SpoVT family DNA-binding domain-containing protein [Gammaproteobacteria bacterium]